MMKTIGFTLLLSLICSLGFGQGPQATQIDSLKHRLTMLKKGKDRVLALVQLSTIVKNASPDSAAAYAQQALDLSRQIKFTRGEAMSLAALSYANLILGDIPTALQSAFTGLRVSEENGYKAEAARCFLMLGIIYSDGLNDHPKAIGYFRKAKERNAAVPDEGENKISDILLDLNLGFSYMRINALDSASFFFERTLYDTSSFFYWVSLMCYGDLQFELGNHQAALASSQKAIHFFAELNDHRSAAEAFQFRAVYHQKMGQGDSCIFYARKSLEEARAISYKQYELKAATLLAEMLESKSAPEALRFYQIARRANDEVYGEKKTQDLLRIISNELERQQEAERAKTAYRNQVRQYALLAGLGVFLLIAFILFRNNRQKQKANQVLNSKNKELEIEAALERVRSASMAMHKSEDLINVATVMYDAIKNLGITQSAQCAFALINEEKKCQELWGSQTDSNLLVHFTLPLIGDQVFLERYEAWKRKEPFFSQKLDAQQLKKHLEVAMPDAEITEEERRSKLDMPETTYFHFGNFSHGYLQIIATEPLDKAQTSILVRFAKAFEQTYTRFLDLQKAEAQAREAQIEAALERVRSRTMAMHKSEELSELVKLMYKEIEPFGVSTFGISIAIFREEENAVEYWYADNLHSDLLQSYKVVGQKNGVFKQNWEDWKNKTPQTQVYLEGQEKWDFDTFILEETDFVKLPEELKQEIRSQKTVCFTFTFFKYGYFESVDLTIPDEENTDVLIRFAKVFEQTYTRFLDLQKAEAQAREAQIEAALERVRSRSLAMHKSDELVDVATVLYKELRNLDVREFSDASIVIFDESKNQQILYGGARTDAEYLEMAVFPLLGDEILQKLYDLWSRKETFFTVKVEGSALKKHCDFVFPIANRTELETKVIEDMPDPTFFHCAYFSMGYLELVADKELSEGSSIILTRFAKVFDQTYTRFLDLQKAEAQAREAQIELAMERVRARSMAMHRSKELSDVVALLFEEIKPFGFASSGIELILPDEHNDTLQFWMTSTAHNKVAECFNIPRTIHPFFQKTWEAWKGQLPRLTLTLEGQEKKEFDRLILTETDFKRLPEEVKQFILNSGYQDVFSSAIMKHGLLESVDTEPISEEQFVILERFAKVFEQTYTRFLDLQKAEAQAREAQIELSLERVRAKAMAMHDSTELSDVLSILFEQFDVLGICPVHAHLSLVDTESNSITFRMTGKAGHRVIAQQIVTVDEWNQLKELIEIFIKSEPGYVQTLHFPIEAVLELWKTFDEIISTIPADFRPLPEDFPNGMYATEGYCKFGYIGFQHYREATEEEKEIVRKFATEFGRLYQRFLDLQKAEAQAREAQIEAALERVRSSTMAMQKSDELSEVVALIYKQIQNLGFPDYGCSIIVCDEEAQVLQYWYSEINYPLQNNFVKVPLTDQPVVQKQWTSWKSGIPQFSIALLGEEKDSYTNFMLNETDYRDLPDAVKEAWKEPVNIYFAYSNMKYGMLEFVDIKPLNPENYPVYNRFAKVFEQTYTRFLDLQKAEARAVEAARTASLDRVRGEIASMRTTDDLQRITPLVWRELTTLGVPFFRCGVFIMDEANELVHAYLSTPDGNSLAALHLPFEGADTTQKTVEHWRKREVYTDFWDKQQFAAWVHSMTEQGYVREEKTYQGGEEPPESLFLQFVPFTQGMLYVGSAKALVEDQIGLVKTLADAFAVAYARYEDFTKLEEAKKRVEATLTELKSTQSQLIQSEKLASLGELTAGIAHEIQNPLNFVNNFSELSVDLANELKDEIKKPEKDWDLIEDLANDLTQNQEKINHHGKRAAAIVTGMLQHARTSTGKKEPTDLNALADEYLRLSYHGLRAKDSCFNANMVTDFDPAVGKVEVIPQDIGRVFLNIINNAFYATQQRWSLQDDKGYEPTVSISSKRTDNSVEFRIKDNGTGIPDDVKARIFQPFFTTKPTGQGTGLGLSLAYDIVMKGHGGTLEVESKEGEGTAFIVHLPVLKNQNEPL